MGDDALLVSDLPPLTDDQFARLQETGDPMEFVREHPLLIVCGW